MFFLKSSEALGIIASALFAANGAAWAVKNGRDNHRPVTLRVSEYYGPDTLAGRGDNARHLVSGGAESREWWEWTYRSRFLPRTVQRMAVSGPFGRVRWGYGHSADSLSGVCVRIHNMSLGELNGRMDYAASDVERFCTPTGRSGFLSFRTD